MIIHKCRHCGTTLTHPNYQVGRKEHCASCGGEVVIPRPSLRRVMWTACITAIVLSAVAGAVLWHSMPGRHAGEASQSPAGGAARPEGSATTGPARNSATAQPASLPTLTLDYVHNTPVASLQPCLGREARGWRLAPAGGIKKYVRLVTEANDTVRPQQILVCDGEGGLRFALADEPASADDANQLNSVISFAADSDAESRVATDQWTITGGGAWTNNGGVTFGGTFIATEFDGVFMPVLAAWRMTPPVGPKEH